MRALPQATSDQLKDLGIGIVYLFGSEAQKAAGPLSDVDIGVVMNDKTRLRNFHDLYVAVHDLIFSLFPARNLDLVFLDRAGLEIQRDAVLYGEVLYEVLPSFRLDYEEHLRLDYADFKPILDLFDRAILERMAP